MQFSLASLNFKIYVFLILSTKSHRVWIMPYKSRDDTRWRRSGESLPFLDDGSSRGLSAGYARYRAISSAVTSIRERGCASGKCNSGESPFMHTVVSLDPPFSPRPFVSPCSRQEVVAPRRSWGIPGLSRRRGRLRRAKDTEREEHPAASYRTARISRRART